jgi:glutamine amidotransferase
MITTLIDSPVANVANIARALRFAGAELAVTKDAATVARAEQLVLPGVGSFAAAMEWLESSRAGAAIVEAVGRGASLLGICVGHQLLFDASHEQGFTRGLGLLRGEVHQFTTALPVPQIGWNRVAFDGSPLFASIGSGTPFYFVNSYAATNAPAEIARAEYGGPFTAAVQSGRVFGVQFHPEKSSTAGLRVLRNFIAWK